MGTTPDRPGRRGGEGPKLAGHTLRTGAAAQSAWGPLQGVGGPGASGEGQRKGGEMRGRDNLRPQAEVQRVILIRLPPYRGAEVTRPLRSSLSREELGIWGSTKALQRTMTGDEMGAAGRGERWRQRREGQLFNGRTPELVRAKGSGTFLHFTQQTFSRDKKLRLAANDSTMTRRQLPHTKTAGALGITTKRQRQTARVRRKSPRHACCCSH